MRKALLLIIVIGSLYSLPKWFVVNTTDSFPPGVYLKSTDPVETGSLVLFCPPQKPIFDLALERGYLSRGFCPGKYSPMIKKSLAAKLEMVEISEAGVFVNGNQIVNSIPLKKDSQGRSMPRFVFSGRIARDQVLLMSDYNPASFDARYFGLLPCDSIIAVLHPLFLWG